jgi:predicted enzyme related to lactoylglutathione lyase
MDLHEYTPGAPNWIDLGSPNPSESVAFYGQLFGWEVFDLGEDAGGYQILALGGRSIAGLGPQQMPGVPYWTVYFSVDDVEVSSQRVIDAGGTVIVPAMDVMAAGRMAVCADPEGAAFSLWQAGDHFGMGAMNESGTPCWFELMARDPEQAIQFYSGVFGWAASTSDMGGVNYTEWKLGDETIGGMMPMDHAFPEDVPAHWMVYFAVDDVDASVATVADLGGQVCVEPTDIPPGRFSVVNDAHGAMFSLMTLNPDFRM